MEIKHILSEKGKQLFVVNGAKFCQARKLSDNCIRWRCVQKFCTAKIYTQGNILNYFTIISFINHVTYDCRKQNCLHGFSA
jgi:hypothetical protein